jgi:hypothetical protein
VLTVDLAATTSKVEDVDGGPPVGCWRQGPAAAITEVEDVDGEPPRGADGKVRQRPPPKLKMSMADTLGVLTADPAVATSEVEDVDGGSPGGAGAEDLGAQRLRSLPLGQGGEWLQKTRTNTQRVVRTHFTLTRVGHFC